MVKPRVLVFVLLLFGLVQSGTAQQAPATPPRTPQEPGAAGQPPASADAQGDPQATFRAALDSCRRALGTPQRNARTPA